MDTNWLLSKLEIKNAQTTSKNKENISLNNSSSISKENSSFSLNNLSSNHSLQPSNPNISFSSYGILATISSNSAHANNKINTSTDSSQLLDSVLIKNSGSGNDSFECDKIKLDVYEKSIQKLANENKSLRKRVKKLTELARTKEEQLIDAFNQAYEDKRKSEEKNKIEHNAQLQSYYECFLQIEKENDSLKIKVEQMKEKMAACLLTQQQMEEEKSGIEKQFINLDGQNVEKKVAPVAQIEDDEDLENEKSIDQNKKEQNEELNKLSLKHIDEELTSLNKSIKLFIEEKQQHQKEDPTVDDNIGLAKNEMEKELTAKNARVSELELEKEALNKKLVSIEASLARWIFRACDYKSDLSKSTEKCSNYETTISDLNESLASMNNEILSANAKLLASTNQIKELNSNIDEKVNELEKLKTLLNELEIKLEAAEKLEKERISNCCKFEDAQTQTNNLEINNHGRLVNNKTSGLVAQTAAKLHQLINNNGSNLTDEQSNVKQQNMNQLNLLAPNTTSSSGLETGTCYQKRIESLTAEIAQLKSKLDGMILEKNSYKCKNEELLSDLNSLKQALELSKSAASHPMANSLSAKKLESLFETRSTQTHPNIKNSSSTQTITVTSFSESTAINLTSVKGDPKVDQLKKELDALKIKLTKEENEFSSELDEKKSELKRLEETIKRLLKQIEELNEKLNDNIANTELLNKTHEEQLIKMNGNFKIEKQISDTIIQQQKKLLYYLQMKLNGESPIESSNSEKNDHHNHHSHSKKFKFKNKSSSHHNSNPLLANLHKTTDQRFINKQQSAQKDISKTNTDINTNKKLNEIETELNSNYEVYSTLTANNRLEYEKNLKSETDKKINSSVKTDAYQALSVYNGKAHKQNPRKQIHVFITGLNTCPTYCHVCQQLIPLIAYASKCQLCSFTCHSTCSSSSTATSTQSSSAISKSKSFKGKQNNLQTQGANANNNLHDPLKYCHINYLTNSIDYNNYINKLISINPGMTNGANSKNTSQLLSDYLYINIDNKWKKLWLSLKQDIPQLDLYQTKTNLKPFDTINLINDKVLIETNMKQIKKLLSTQNVSSQSAMLFSQTVPSSYSEINENHCDDADNIYEELSVEPTNLINFEQSSLVILLYNSKLSLKIGFTSFNKKNTWYDALQSSILIGQSMSSLKKSSSSQSIASSLNTSSSEQFKFFNINKVLKPFLELCDTVVNSYCFINENLLALACDDGLYTINSLVQTANNNSNNTNQTSLVKIDSIESAHKLYYQEEFGKLCFIGRKSRQFLSIDLTDLNKALINYDSDEDKPENYDDNDDYYDDDAKSVKVELEHILNIDRCHLFECSLNKNGYWYMAVATPEIIFILLFNKVTNKYTMVKTIQTANDSPCICLKFTTNLTINQLIYGSGKEFYKMDMTYLQSSPMLDNFSKKHSFDIDLNSTNQQPIAVCVIDSPNTQLQAVLLCYEEFGLFLVYNFSTQTWQQPFINGNSVNSSKQTKSGSSSSITQTNASSSNLTQSSFLKWPRGNGLTPLQIEYDSSYLYLFYNDSIVAYSVKFENELLCVKKCGITFVYKPKFLSTLHTTNINFLIISNRRPLESSQDALETSPNPPNIPKIDEEYENEDDEDKSSLTKVNNHNDQEINDKICLSYFSPDTN